MKATLLSTILATTLFASSSFAALLTTNAGDKSIEGVKIAKDGQVNINGQQIPVSIIGSGLRTKKVLIVNVKVYVAELLSSDASKFVRSEDQALSSLDQSRTIALRLTFLRGVDAETVQTSYKEALDANNINTSDAGVAQFLAAVKAGGDADNGKTMTIVTSKEADGSETVYYEGTKGGEPAVIKGSKGLSNKLMAIWLGQSADSGLETLKAQIIKGN
jgi:hypothetical protein